MSKSIYIDATHFGTTEPTGVERYVEELLPLLSKKLVAKNIEVSWVGHDRPKTIPLGVKWVLSPYQSFWSQRSLPKLLKEKKPDLFFTPSGIAPVFPPVPTAMTVHDLSFYDYPAAYSKTDLFRLRALSPHAARKTACIFTPTEYVKETIVQHWNVAPERIVVTPLAYTPSGEGADSVEGVPEQDPYVLFVGRVEEKKNLVPLIHAVAATEGLSLVIAGKNGVGSENILSAIWAFPDSVKQRIILLGYITEAQKRWLYQHAFAVAVPGLAEGFGFSVLEGFYYNVPVIASASGSLPEVAGDGAVLINGRGSTAWQETLQELMREPDLRQSLITHGARRLQDFSWENCATVTAKALIAALESPVPNE